MNNEREEYIKKLENLILHCYDACLCKRETYGFDYGENHRTLGREKGSRFTTPKNMIKSTIGSEWVYKHPTKPGQSTERLNFKTLEHAKGYKSESEWKEVSSNEKV